MAGGSIGLCELPPDRTSTAVEWGDGLAALGHKRGFRNKGPSDLISGPYYKKLWFGL